MKCQDAQLLLHAHADRELDLMRHVEVEEHLTGCPACAAASGEISRLKSLLQQEGLYHRAPAALRSALAKQYAASRPPKARPFASQWLGPALGLAALLMFVLGQQFVSFRERNTLADQLVDDHVRSLMAAHLTDVASTDQHTVKPWFEGKLDFAPPVRDLATQGFPLRGGRLDYLDRRAVAALVYQRHSHWINLFVAPAEKPGEAAPQTTVRRGFNIVAWDSAGMSFHAVSDLNGAELRDFALALSKE